MSTEEIIFKNLIDRIDTLQRSNAITNQNQSRLEAKINWIIALLKDKKDRERERGY
jgi:hypothetical protein